MQIDLEHATLLTQQLAAAAQPVNFQIPPLDAPADLSILAQLHTALAACDQAAAAQRTLAVQLAENSMHILADIRNTDETVGYSFELL